MFGILDILKLKGLRWTSTTRLVRHQSPTYPVEELRRQGSLELYQCYQSRPVFHRVDQILVFQGAIGTRAIFLGVYEVIGHRPANKGLIDAKVPWSLRWNSESKYYYELEKNDALDEFRDRLVIDWGRGRQWIQKPINKPVLAVTEPGRSLAPFEDYLEFSSGFDQLRDLFTHPNAHPEWRARLSAVAGVYLVLAEGSGDLYVGSACGDEGIWSRWRNYADSGHGGNQLLKKLIARDPSYPRGFRFSVLQVLPKSMAREEVFRRERVYKEKLGSRATGLNLN